MKFLVVGSGSAAKKFINYLLEKKHHVYVYMHRKDLEIPDGCTPHFSLDTSMFDAGIIASPSSKHLIYARSFIEQRLPTLIEKPLSDSMRGVKSLFLCAQKKKTVVLVGFNLRFLPVVKTIRTYIKKEKLGTLLHADLYVGQYLPEWRPWLDYRKNYSASHALGGGVSLDLIHELDLALHFFPTIKLQPIFSSKLGDLEIDTEDFVCFQTKRKPFVSVRMDYLNHVKTRQYRIVGADGSIFCDIFNKSFIYRNKKGKEEIISDPTHFDIPTSFKTELDHFIKAIKRKESELSERTLGIDALKLAVKGRKYV